MKNNKKINNSIIFSLIITLLAGVCLFFCSSYSPVNAETQAHTVYFHWEQYYPNKQLVEVIVNDGETIEANSTKIPALEDDKFVWAIGDKLTNISSDVHVYLIPNPAKKYTVLFVFPDGSSMSRQVYEGESISDPPEGPALGFGEKYVYNQDLENITSDLEVTVTVSKTTKYVIIALCGAVIIASLVVIVIIVCNYLLKDNSNDGNNENSKQENDTEAKIN